MSAAVEHSTLGRFTIIANQPDAIRPLDTCLQTQGAEVSWMKPDELDTLPHIRPGLVLIGAETGSVWQAREPAELQQLFAAHKVIGIGQGGCDLFGPLGLELGNVMGYRDARVVVALSELIPAAPFPSAPLVEVYQSSEVSVLGVYDQAFAKEHGEPATAGFEGIAHWEQGPHYWPIARQGNYVLWGFTAPMDQLTEQGQRLFMNLIMNHLARPNVPLVQARKSLAYIEPGLVTDSLTAQYSESRWHFQVRQIGRIYTRLSWQPAEQELALILNGPGVVNCYARQDGRSPQELAFEVTEAHLAKGLDWCISAGCFGFHCASCDMAGCELINFTLQLDFPDA